MELEVICFQSQKEKKRKSQGSHFFYFDLDESHVGITSNFAIPVYYCGFYFMVRMEVKCIFITTFMLPIYCMSLKDIIMLIMIC